MSCRWWQVCLGCLLACACSAMVAVAWSNGVAESARRRPTASVRRRMYDWACARVVREGGREGVRLFVCVCCCAVWLFLAVFVFGSVARPHATLGCRKCAHSHTLNKGQHTVAASESERLDHHCGSEPCSARLISSASPLSLLDSIALVQYQRCTGGWGCQTVSTPAARLAERRDTRFV